MIKESSFAELEKLNLSDLINNALHCPFSGHTKLIFVWKTSYSHGGSEFESARVKCCNCSGSKGDLYGYDRPTLNQQKQARLQWNERIKF